MLSGLMGELGAIAPVNGVSEVWPLKRGAPFRLTILPVASLESLIAPLSDGVSLLDYLSIALHDTELFGGGVVKIEWQGNSLVFSGVVSRDWAMAGDFRDALLRFVFPYSNYDFEAEVSPPPVVPPPVVPPPVVPPPVAPPPVAPSKIFGIDTGLILIGGLAVLIFMGGKEK